MGGDDLFTINPDTGLITTTESLDHENMDSHTIIVQVCSLDCPRVHKKHLVLSSNFERPNLQTVFVIEQKLCAFIVAAIKEFLQCM